MLTESPSLFVAIVTVFRACLAWKTVFLFSSSSFFSFLIYIQKWVDLKIVSASYVDNKSMHVRGLYYLLNAISRRIVTMDEEKNYRTS